MSTVALRIVYLGPNDAALHKNFAFLGKQVGCRPLSLETGLEPEERISALPLSFAVGAQPVTLWLYAVPSGLRHAAVRTTLIDQSDGVVFVALPEGEATEETQKHYDQLIADLQRGEDRSAVPTLVQLPAPAASDAVGFRRLPQHLVTTLDSGDQGIAQTLSDITARSLSGLSDARLAGLSVESLKQAITALLFVSASD